MDDMILTPVIPEIFIACIAMFLLLLGAFTKMQEGGFLFKLAIAALLLTASQLIQFSFTLESTTALNGLFILDEFAVFVKIAILIAGAFVLVMTVSFRTSENKTLPFEYAILSLLAIAGMMAMVSANDLMSLYMGLELQSLSLYVMTAVNRDSERASEAGLKYFMLGALASGLLLFGASLIYGFSGSTNFTELAALYETTATDDLPLGTIVGLVLVLAGLCFKVSAAPFHMWTPDVYEGAPKPVTAFFAIVPKAAAVALLIRVLAQPFDALFAQWQQIILVVSIASMVVGSFGALMQTNIKRLMAYSSIGHVGFMLVGLAAGMESGIQAMLVYMVIYMVMSIGTFACILLMQRGGIHLEEIADLSGVAKSRPIFAVALTILMLSMAGVPPMAGFFAKFFIFKAALEAELYGLAVTGVVLSVVSAFYYLRIIKVMYFDAPPKETLHFETPQEMQLTLLAATLLNLLFFLYPTPLLDIAGGAAGALF